MLNCNMMVRSLRRVTIKAKELPIDVVVMKVKEPIDRCEMESLEQKQQRAQIGELCAKTTQGWSTQGGSMNNIHLIRKSTGNIRILVV